MSHSRMDTREKMLEQSWKVFEEWRSETRDLQKYKSGRSKNMIGSLVEYYEERQTQNIFDLIIILAIIMIFIMSLLITPGYTLEAFILLIILIGLKTGFAITPFLVTYFYNKKKKNEFLEKKNL